MKFYIRIRSTSPLEILWLQAKSSARWANQLKDSARNTLNPIDYWDRQGRIDPNPAPPARLDDYQRYLATPGAAMGDTVAGATDGRSRGCSGRSPQEGQGVGATRPWANRSRRIRRERAHRDAEPNSFAQRAPHIR